MILWKLLVLLIVLKNFLILILIKSSLDSWILILIILESWILNLLDETFSWIFLLILELFLTQSWNHSLGLFSSSLLSSKHLESILIHHHEAMKFASAISPFLMMITLKSRNTYTFFFLVDHSLTSPYSPPLLLNLCFTWN